MEEILHQLTGSLSHFLHGFTHPRWCRISSINSINKSNLTESPDSLQLIRKRCLDGLLEYVFLESAGFA